MKKSIIMVALLLTVLTLKAQVLHPVTWSYGSKKINATEAVVFFKATIETGWHIYSQNIKEGGPVKTSFHFDESKEYMTSGKTSEPKPIIKMEKVFNMNVGYFENAVVFQQKIKLKRGSTTVHGQLEYMTCNDHQCLPPEDINFNILIK